MQLEDTYDRNPWSLECYSNDSEGTTKPVKLLLLMMIYYDKIYEIVDLYYLNFFFFILVT